MYTPQECGYAGKVLFVKKGCKLSFQYHDIKQETIVLFSGSALIWLENAQGEIEKISMELQQGYTVVVNQKHRIEALEDSFLLESSTPEAGVTVRVEDDFHREDETEELRKQTNRGWNQ